MVIKILLIDDDVDLVEVNKTYLSKRGFEVFAAYNGEEGIAIAKNIIPDVIILDVMMTTVGEGFEVAQEIRKTETIKHAQILMLTSVNEQHDFPIRFGPDQRWNPVNAFFEKPIEPEKLLQAVNNLINNSNQ
jgi:DNA-binding response OmpR family regulator